MSDDFQSHERVTATKLNRSLRSGRCIGRARRISSSSIANSATLVPVLRLDDIPMTGQRAYDIKTSTLLLDASVANDVGRIVLTYTTDGSTPTISSSVLPGGEYTKVLPNIAVAEGSPLITTYVPAADETFSLLMSVARFSGTGNIIILGSATVILEMKIVDMGEDVGDTGVDL